MVPRAGRILWLVFALSFFACDEGVGSTAAAVVDGPVSFAVERDVSGGDVRGLSALDAADVDGDGDPDIAAFEGGGHAGGRVTFAWFESPSDPGSGDFTRHELTRPSPFRPFIGAARFGDVDGDGDPDVVVAMDNHSGGTRSAYVHWLENPRPAGSATDDAWTVHTVASNLPLHHINDMELADMDGDGRLDIVARALDPNQLHIWFQDGGAAWTNRAIDSSPYGANGEGFALGDIDGDGDVDITICGHWLEGPSAPRTGAYVANTIDAEYATINANTKEATGDIDGDGRLDVIISPAEGYRGGGNHVLAWYRGPADPAAATSWDRTVLASDLNGAHTIRLADMDGDGDLDAVSGVAWNLWGQTAAVTVYYNLGGGAFGNVQTVVTGKGLYSGVVVDVGNDGDLDIIGQDTYSSSSRPYLYESLEGPGAPVTDAGTDTAVSPGTDSGAPMGGDAEPMPGRDGGGMATPDGSVGPEPPDSGGGCGCVVAAEPRADTQNLALLLALGTAGLVFCRSRDRRRRRH